MVKVRVWKGTGSVALTQVFQFNEKEGGLYGFGHAAPSTPLTGRTHQLRVQCALRGITRSVGDKSYGDFSFNRKIARAAKVDRLMLACWRN